MRTVRTVATSRMTDSTEMGAGKTADFAKKPALIFWETTRACSLSCVHCRASAQTAPLPDELETKYGFDVIDQATSFSQPYPTMIFTGGDPLERTDLFDLLSYAKESGVRFAVSPAVTPLLTDRVLERFADFGAASVSISLDGACAETHESIRKVKGTFDRTIERIRKGIELGLKVQVNTAVMKLNFTELPRIFHLIKGFGVKTWEVFFLVRTGRGVTVEDLSPAESESVCHFLYDASRSGVMIRCVEAPFIRRIASEKNNGNDPWNHVDYIRLRRELVELDGKPSGASSIRARGTLDGDGIVFVGYDGSIYPGGLLPVRIGNTREDSLPRAYKEDPLMRRIRERKLNGPCGTCQFKEICGGSRARAYAHNNDPLGSDPACILVSGNVLQTADS